MMISTTKTVIPTDNRTTQRITMLPAMDHGIATMHSGAGITLPAGDQVHMERMTSMLLTLGAENKKWMPRFEIFVL